MKNKIKILELKILLVIMEIFLLLLICTLLKLVFHPRETEKNDEVKQTILELSEIEKQINDTETIQCPMPGTSEAPFIGDFSAYDKIRVVITNKENGSIFHENAEEWKDRKDYRGVFEIFEEEAGDVVVNELSIEEYLYSVVPSEMPASYPLEALKAQAICARTYAYLHIMSPGYPKYNAHVDDTTAYQVYHNIEEQETTTLAVNETIGKILLAPDGNEPAQTYYYSTSCGYGSDAHVWRTKYSDAYPYIRARHINKTCQGNCSLNEEELQAYFENVNQEDYEVKEPWYRWSYRVEDLNTEHMFMVLQKRHEVMPDLILTKKGDDFISQPIKKFKKVKDIRIIKREAGGVADEMLIVTEKQTIKVITELNIRYVLNDGCSKVVRQDGSSVDMGTLLPSAFMCLEVLKNKNDVYGYNITGGGYGHGAGMSQNAAKVMAAQGMNAEEIIKFFFGDCKIHVVENRE